MIACKSKKFLQLGILIFTYFIFISPKLLKNRFIIVVGPTRSGKSCFINTITQNDLTLVGDESGESTTKNNDLFEARIHGFPEKQPFLIGDTMGWNDDSEESGYADNVILSNVTLFINNTMNSIGIDLDGILIFESLLNDANNLQKTIKKLKSVFSDKINNKIIVVLNKNLKPHPKRKERLLKILEEDNIKYIHWKSNCEIDKIADEYYNQMNLLHDLISKLQPFNRNEINKIVGQLKDEGKEIFRIRMNESEKQSKYSFEWFSAYLMDSLVSNLPEEIISKFADLGFEDLKKYLNDDVNYLIGLAIEERIKNQFNKNDEF